MKIKQFQKTFFYRLMFQDPKGYLSQMCEVHLETSMETVQQRAGF